MFYKIILLYRLGSRKSNLLFQRAIYSFRRKIWLELDDYIYKHILILLIVMQLVYIDSDLNIYPHFLKHHITCMAEYSCVTFIAHSGN
jgi:hypothetical protein